MITHSLPVSTTMLNAIEKFQQQYRTKCKKCGGSGFSGSYTPPKGLPIKQVCGECDEYIQSVSRLILAGMGDAYLNIRKWSDQLDKEDRLFLQTVEKLYRTDPEAFRFICLSSSIKGVGKTGSTACLIAHILDAWAKETPNMATMPVTWITANHLIQNIYQGFRFSSMSPHDREKHKAYMDSVTMNHILVVDGLGDHYIKSSEDADESFVGNEIERIF